MIAFTVIMIFFKMFFYGLAFESTGYIINMGPGTNSPLYS